MSAGVLVFLEHDEKRLHGEMKKLAAKAAELAHDLGGRCAAALIGHIDSRLLSEAQALACHELIVASDPVLSEYHPELYREALYSAVETVKPRIVLLRHSYMGIELGPALAFRLGAPIVSNCLEIEARDSRTGVIRPYCRESYWGKLSLSAPLCFFTLQRISLRGNPIPREPVTVRRLSFQAPARLRIRCGGIRRRVESIDISQAEKIVAVGRGIRDKESIKLAEELAQALGATLACSRPIVDMGWLPVERQVGISGKTVRPKVYLACGISGEAQHVAGMKDASLIIAINSDPKAPIFRVAHYGVVADLFAILPALTEAALRGKREF